MKKDHQNLLMLVLVVGIVWAFAGGGIPGQQAITQTTAGTTTTDGITIETGTPTLEWYAINAITGKSIAPAHFRVSAGGSRSDYLSNDTINVSRGDNYTVCLMPNSTYYSVCKSGVIAKTVTKVNLEAYAIGSATIWVNNDVENSTTRNSVTAYDTLASDDTDTPTVCVQGATAGASYGNGKIIFIFDYNGSQIDQLQFNKGTHNDTLIPSTYVTDSNVGTSKIAYVMDIYLTNQETVCGSLTVDGAVLTSGWPRSDITVDVYDYFKFRDSVTDELKDGFARTTDGADTNSATNATTVTYYIH